jgi:hypothetical protein
MGARVTPCTWSIVEGDPLYCRQIYLLARARRSDGSIAHHRRHITAEDVHHTVPMLQHIAKLYVELSNIPPAAAFTVVTTTVCDHQASCTDFSNGCECHQCSVQEVATVNNGNLPMSSLQLGRWLSHRPAHTLLYIRSISHGPAHRVIVPQC